MLGKSSALVATVAVLLAGAAPAAAQRSDIGAAGSGDPFFPLAGNDGYDVRHYDLELEYAPGGTLTGRAGVRARASQRLARFNLDLRDFFTVSRVYVDGRRATFTHAGQELSITPARPLRARRLFTVRVDYAGVPQPVVDPDETQEGWLGRRGLRRQRAAGLPGLVPGQRHAPRQGDVRVRHHAARVQRRRPRHARERRHRTEPGPGLGAPGPPGRDRRLLRGALRPLSLHERRGDRRLGAGGGLRARVPDEGQLPPHAGVGTIVHEIAHQWFGNSVTLSTWPDIWLNEGFATWSQWIYDERHGGRSAQARFEELHALAPGTPAGDALWGTPPAALSAPESLFARSVYDRGAMTLQALRSRVGDDVFFGILRAWYAEHRDGNVATADFVARAERASGQELDAFFRVWLYETGRPAAP